MDLDPTSLVVSFIIGGVGFVLVVYGKKMSRIPHFLAGLVMLVYPYFVPSVILNLVIFAVLSGGLFFAVKQLGM
ncbi:MAG: hypothetical protein R3B13_19165 [Polyangiaceae bacterium]